MYIRSEFNTTSIRSLCIYMRSKTQVDDFIIPFIIWIYLNQSIVFQIRIIEHIIHCKINADSMFFLQHSPYLTYGMYQTFGSTGEIRHSILTFEALKTSLQTELYRKCFIFRCNFCIHIGQSEMLTVGSPGFSSFIQDR